MTAREFFEAIASGRSVFLDGGEYFLKGSDLMYKSEYLPEEFSLAVMHDIDFKECGYAR